MVLRFDNYPKINSFADAERRYAEIKVMRSKHHPIEQDVRPLGTRSRKYERIKKLSDDCYIMLDGCYQTDDIFNSQRSQWRKTKLDPRYAPITWTREGSTESIRIRNGIGDGAHSSRYTFLENWLPKGLYIWIENGKQYVAMSKVEANYRPYALATDKKFFLPKTLYGSYRYDEDLTDKLRVDGKNYLTFTRHQGEHTWRPQGDTFEYVPQKKIVDKEAKKKLQPYIESHWEYITTMYNLLDIKRARSRDEYDWHSWHGRSQHNSDYLERVKNEDKDDKLSFAVEFLTEEGCTQFTVLTEEDRKRLRRLYNQWINKKMGLLSTMPPQVVRKSNK
jgi:hypothetical protein